MLAATFVAGGVTALRHSETLAGTARPVTDTLLKGVRKVAPQAPVPTNEVTLVRLNAATQIAAALGLATGRAPRLCATVLAASLAPTTIAGHRWWEESDPEQRTNQQVHFFKNVSMLGGLVLAAVDTEGRPGVAWRTQHAVTGVRREAKHLRREARAQARLAAKSARAIGS